MNASNYTLILFALLCSVNTSFSQSNNETESKAVELSELKVEGVFFGIEIYGGHKKISKKKIIPSF